MKIKVYVIDMEIPVRIQKWALGVGVPAAVALGGGAVAWASGLVTWTSGQTLQAADLNNNFSYLQNQITGDGGVQGEIAALQGEIAGDAGVEGQITALQAQVHPASAFRAHLATPTTFPSGGTTVLFDSVEFDLAGEYTSATGVFAPHLSTGKTGVYLISCEVWGQPAGSGNWAASIYLNGTQIDANDDQLNTSALGTSSSRALTIVQLHPGDGVICNFFQTTGSVSAGGGTYASRNSFSAARLF